MIIDKFANKVTIELSNKEGMALYHVLDFYRKHNSNFLSDVWYEETCAKLVSEMQGNLWHVFGGE